MNNSKGQAGDFTQQFSEYKDNPRLLSPLTLAFVGDGVFELLVREQLVAKGSMPAGKLHKLAVEQVRASAQAACYDALSEALSEEEADILRRGRNANVRPPKSCTVEDYHKATAIEALFGYLYLCGRRERIAELFTIMGDCHRGAQEKGEQA